MDGIVHSLWVLFDVVAGSRALVGTVNEYHIGLAATSYVVRKGRKIRVEVESGDFNRYDRSLNTGEALGAGTRMVSSE